MYYSRISKTLEPEPFNSTASGPPLAPLQLLLLLLLVLMITTIIIRLTIYLIVVCCGNGWIGLGDGRRARHAVVKPPIK